MTHLDASARVEGEERSDNASRPTDREDHLTALPPGTMLFEYRINGVLGQGGFGITYAAEDTHLHEAVAIKEYFPSRTAVRTGDQSARARSKQDATAFEQGVVAFLNEARLIARFRHPNLMRVRRFFEAHGTGYMVLDFVDGRSLEAAMADGTLPEATVRTVLDGILAGLSIIHDEAVLHRDLKPRNVILRHDLTPVLIDFGAARDFGSRDSGTVTQIVSPGYSSPEQYGIGERQGPWSDFYSVGAILYRAVTGVAPVDALRRLRNDPLVPASVAAAGRYDDRLLALVDALLAVDPTARPRSTAEIVQRLAAPTDLPSQTVDAASPPARGGWWTSRRAALVAAVAVILIAVGVALPKFVPGWRHAGPAPGTTAQNVKPPSHPDPEIAKAISRPIPPPEPTLEIPATSPVAIPEPSPTAPSPKGAAPSLKEAENDRRAAAPEPDVQPPPTPDVAAEPALPKTEDAEASDSRFDVEALALPDGPQITEPTAGRWRACVAAGYCDARLLPAVAAGRDDAGADLPSGEQSAYQMWSSAVLGRVYRMPWQALPDDPSDTDGTAFDKDFAEVTRPICPACDDLQAGPIVDPAKHVPLPLGLIDDGDPSAPEESPPEEVETKDDAAPTRHVKPSHAAASWHHSPARASGNEMLRRRTTRHNPCAPVRVGRFQIFGHPAAGGRPSPLAGYYGSSWQAGCVYGTGR